MATVSTAAQLGREIHNDTDTIIVEGDLSNKVIRIKATGKVDGQLHSVQLLQH